MRSVFNRIIETEVHSAVVSTPSFSEVRRFPSKPEIVNYVTHVYYNTADSLHNPTGKFYACIALALAGGSDAPPK